MAGKERGRPVAANPQLDKLAARCASVRSAITAASPGLLTAPGRMTYLHSGVLGIPELGVSRVACYIQFADDPFLRVYDLHLLTWNGLLVEDPRASWTGDGACWAGYRHLAWEPSAELPESRQKVAFFGGATIPKVTPKDVARATSGRLTQSGYMVIQRPALAAKGLCQTWRPGHEIEAFMAGTAVWGLPGTSSGIALES